jgi:uncharacterized phage protein gp47/JayE
MRAREFGVTRYPATRAIKRGYFTNSQGDPVFVPLGSRFSTVSESRPLIYSVVSAHTLPGYYDMECETAGTEGNEYTGPLNNITFISGLSTAIMQDLIVSARDVETDEELRSRYFEAVETKAFGGNIADYKNKLRDINGIGGAQIYPVWNGGGTVKISIVDSEYNACAPEFIADVQEMIDPVDASGQGIGLAPIDHTVSVVTANETTVNVTATVTLLGGFVVGQVQQEAEIIIEEYFHSLRESWDTSDRLNNYSLSVYRSRIMAALLSISGVSNVSSVILNGVDNDLALTQSSATQQLPILGSVVINE